MTPVSIIITAVAALLGGGGIASILTARATAKRSTSQSETEARAQFTGEFNAIVAQLNLQIERLEKRVTGLDNQVNDIQSKHEKAEDYIDILIVGISNGTIPPIPPRI